MAWRISSSADADRQTDVQSGDTLRQHARARKAALPDATVTLAAPGGFSTPDGEAMARHYRSF
jgi:hypothetical protein